MLSFVSLCIFFLYWQLVIILLTKLAGKGCCHCFHSMVLSLSPQSFKRCFSWGGIISLMESFMYNFLLKMLNTARRSEVVFFYKDICSSSPSFPLLVRWNERLYLIWNGRKYSLEHTKIAYRFMYAFAEIASPFYIQYKYTLSYLMPP